MKIQLQFKNIVDQPRCRILINDQVLFVGITQLHHAFDVEIPEGACRLTIVHYDKAPNDTIVENGVIVRDRSFELEHCVIDGYDLQELVWHSKFVADDGAVYKMFKETWIQNQLDEIIDFMKVLIYLYVET
jgi:hypothetical protein